MIFEWIKVVKNYIFWCLILIKVDFLEMILVKWKLFMCYVLNKYIGYFDSNFEKCVYDENIEFRKWIKVGMLI